MMDYRSQRRIYRQQRRAFRNSRRGVFGGIGGSVWLIILLFFVLGNHWIWFPMMFLAIPFFLFVLRPMFSNMFNATNNPPQYNQFQQSQQPPVYQQDQPVVYKPYNQGYQPQDPITPQTPSYQEGGQEYPYSTQQQQYEEPLIMYPQQEMPPQGE